MNRVLVTGGAGTIGAAVVRRLLRDPDFEVRVSDQREAPKWMREGCEVHTGDLRDARRGAPRDAGLHHVIHLAAIVGGIANFHKLPHTLTEVNNALYNAVVRAALDHGVERFVYVSSSMVFERATEYPTTEEHIWTTPIPQSAYGFSKLTGEVYVRAAHDEHGLPYTICRPFNAYGPGEMPEDEPGIAHMVPDVIKKCLALPPGAALPIFGDGTQTRTLTHIDDIADGIVAAMAAAAGLNEDFNISASDERTVAELARVIWEECGRRRRTSRLEHLPTFEVDVVRRWPSVEKAERLLGLEVADRAARRHPPDGRLAARRRRRGCADRRAAGWLRTPRTRVSRGEAAIVEEQREQRRLDRVGDAADLGEDLRARRRSASVSAVELAPRLGVVEQRRGSGRRPAAAARPDRPRRRPRNIAATRSSGGAANCAARNAAHLRRAAGGGTRAPAAGRGRTAPCARPAAWRSAGPSRPPPRARCLPSKSTATVRQ